MATETTNYHFIKPDDSDPVDNTPLNQNFDSIDAAIADHVADTNNPHQVTKEQIGLGNVDNVATKDVLAELVDSGAKNLIPVSVTSSTSVGIVYTVSDGIITLESGTAANNPSLIGVASAITIAKGTYVLSGCPSGGGDSSYRLDMRIQGTSIVLAIDNGGTAEITLTSDTICSFFIRLIGGYQVSTPLTFKPMLCTKAAWDISQKYIPYRPSYDELVARIEALEQAAGINSVRSMANLTTETAADATETEGEEEMR